VDLPPVLLVHGWGGSFARTWADAGWPDLLADEGRTVIGIDLLGHGEAPKPHDPAAYTDLTARVNDAIGDHGCVDAIAFSLGAMTTLALAARDPGRFRRIVVGGVGENVFRNERTTRIVDAVRGTGDPDDVLAGVFAQYASQPGNDREALAACLDARGERLTPEVLSSLAVPVLVVLGDRDFAGPATPLVEALPNASFKELRNTDHFATPTSFGFIDAALAFLR
jgi:pimeloyl-ACP methyl ester carboxylesterase